MRNIGVYTTKPVDRDALVELLREFAAQQALGWSDPSDPGGQVILTSRSRDGIYVLKDTAVANGCVDGQELEAIKRAIGVSPASYVDLHFTSTPGAFPLADRLAREIQARWPGVIDYDGAGGGLGTVPRS